MRVRPLKLNNLSLVIRGGTVGEKTFRPTLLFRPSAGDVVGNPRSMISVTGGEVEFENLDLWLQVPDAPAARWSLMELRRPNEIRLTKCSLTIENSRDGLSTICDDVAVFRTVSMTTAEPASGQQSSPVIHLSDTIVRGEATLLRSPEASPLRLWWLNGLLATTERLFDAGGAKRTFSDGQDVEVFLDNVTAVLGRGLCRVAADTTDAPRMLPLRIVCKNGILVMPRETPLIEQRGPGSLDELENRFFFTDEGQRNLYVGTEIFWQMFSTADQSATDLDYGEWSKHKRTSEMLPKRTAQIEWQTSPPAAPLYQHRVMHYLPSDQSSNPARNADGVLGLQTERLPKFPSADAVNGVTATSSADQTPAAPPAP